MASEVHLPEYVTRLEGGAPFTFACHKGVECFTDCCRMLELALTPYDVLRLRRGTSLSSRELLDEYIIIEQDPGEPFPRFYLTMVDDGRASCVFVSSEGCTVYPHRPSACRAYPLGRAAVRSDDGTVSEHFVLLKETHCHGFEETTPQTPLRYSLDQELTDYNTFNDAVAQILQHVAIRQGLIPSRTDIELFTLALYDLDTFRRLLMEDKVEAASLTQAEKDRVQDDEQLLLYAIEWLKSRLFGIF